MTQIAAETLGLPLEDVTFTARRLVAAEGARRGRLVHRRLGRSAVKAACEKVRETAVRAARKVDGSPLADASSTTWTSPTADPPARDPSAAVSIVEAMRHGEVDVIEEEAIGRADSSRRATRATRTRRSSPRCGSTRTSARSASRGSSARSPAGRILNPKTARSQILGGVVWGIGMALEEESVLDHTVRPVHEPQPGRLPRPGATPTCTTSR